MEKAFQRPPEKRKRSNDLWETASEIALLTRTEPRKWLRLASKYPYEVKRSLIDFKELWDPSAMKTPDYYFLFLVNKHRKDSLHVQ